MKWMLCTLFVGSLQAQVLVETGVLTGATAAAGGAAGKGTGKALTNVFGKVEKTLNSATQTQPAASARIPPAEEKPAAPVKLPDVAQITTGMTREDLVAKFGPPSQKMTIPEGSHITERYRYDVDKDTVKILLEDGKVTEATSTRPAPPQEKP
jgi:hypothetical protein